MFSQPATRRTSGCADDRPDGRERARDCRSSSPTTPSRTRTTCSSRPTPSARTTGRRCPTPTAHHDDDQRRRSRAHRLGHAAPVPGPLPDERTSAAPRTRLHDTGTTGAWNAATGNSGGFQDWNVDLSAFAGKQVEVSITYARTSAVRASACSSTTSRSRTTGQGAERDVVRGRPRRLGGPGRAGGQRGQRQRVAAHGVGRLRRRARASRRRHRSTGASASRGSRCGAAARRSSWHAMRYLGVRS